MAAFTFFGSGSQASTETVTTLSVNLPGSTQLGDVFFLVCRSMSAAAATFTPPSTVDAEQIGSRLTVDINVPQSSRPIGTLQVFWWVHDGTGSSVQVSASVTGSFQWLAQIFAYRGTGIAALAGTPVDATAAPSAEFTGPDFAVSDSDVTAINITFAAGVSGGLNIINSQGWTSQRTLATVPGGRWFDITGTAGTYTSPTVRSGFSRPWLCKVWALSNPPRPVPLGGWSVGQIKY